MIRTLAAILVVSIATACAPAEGPAGSAAPPAEPASSATVDAAPPDPATPDDCKASTYAALVGKPLSDPGVPPASPSVRHIRPGDAVTEDYRVERLNIHVSASDIIEKVNCG